MAINLNDALYGAQFRAFQALANDTKLDQDSLVSVDESNRGKGLLNEAGERRKIVVKNDGDEIRSLANPFFSRKKTQRDLNNEVRNLFKETVLKVCGAKTLDDLPKAVQDVMKKGDYDNGGHPLSLRRIRAVTSAILAEAQKETEAGGAQGGVPAAGIGAAPGNGVPEIDDADSSVDDDEVAFKYDTPDYAADLPAETEEAFMEFYCDAVDKSVEDGRTKEDCDEMLREMFRTVGYGKGDRKLLAELLANGKPAFLEKDGTLPLRYDGLKFAEKLKAILDKTNEYRAQLPKAYRNIVADTVLATLKTVDRIFDVDDLPFIDADTCDQISAAAEKVDTAELLAPPPAKGFDAKSLDKRLENFRRKAAVAFADNLLSPNDSDLKATIKQNLLMNLALARAASPKDSLADAIEEHYDTLAGRYGKRDLLAEIAPGLGTK